jgi:hypothetical protein
VSEQAVNERLAPARAAVSRAAWIESYDLLVREEDLDGWTNASESVDKVVDRE